METERRKEIEACSPAKEIMDDAIKRCLANGKPQYKQDGTMTFDYFIECIKISAETVMNHTRDTLDQHRETRRKYLKENNMEGYREAQQKSTAYEQQTTQIVDATIY